MEKKKKGAIPESTTPNLKSYRKDTKKATQLQTIFHYLQNHTATATMIFEATGISQKNICRYKRDLEKQGRLTEVKKGYCESTKHSAWYLTTNKELFINDSQLSLF